jgi:hypothetical protein
MGSNSSTGAAEPAASRAPVLPPDIPQVWLHTRFAPALVTWRPAILGVADVTVSNAKLGVSEQMRRVRLAPVDADMLTLDWADAELLDLDVDELSRTASAGAAFDPVPAPAATTKNYAAWTRTLQKFITTSDAITLYQSKALKLVSHVGETEGAFRARLQLAAREAVDAKVDAVRKKYAVRVQTAQDKVRRAEQTIEQKENSASQAKLSTALSVGGALFGALFSRKKLSAGNLGKLGTAARSAARTQQHSGNVARAGENHAAAVAALEELEARIAEELALEANAFDALTEQLDEVVVRPKSTDVHVQVVALAWVPWVTGEHGALTRG